MCTAGDFTITVQLTKELWQKWKLKISRDKTLTKTHFKKYFHDQLQNQLSKQKIVEGFVDAKQNIEIAAIFLGYDNADLM